MKPFLYWFEKLRCSRWVAVALSGGLFYLVQAVQFAHQTGSTLDEGNYLYKGFLFVRGVYAPYQPYGPWTNKMPLAFILPGIVQSVFTPGLRAGRYFAIVLGLLMLLAMWIVIRRFAGLWWAAGVVWVIAVSPWLVRSYSQALSEGMIATMLAWVFVMVLGAGRPLWQIVLGSLLAGVAIMTRENMLPLAALVILYVWWERGWRFALVSAAACLGLLAVFHAVYWPEVMWNWARQIPAQISPFLNRFRFTVPGDAVWGTQPLGWLARLYAFWEGMRYQFVPVFGTLVAWVLWPRRRDWKSDSNFKVAVCLSAFLVVMTAAHAWSSVLKNYCVFCFSLYMAFFGLTGFVILAASVSSWLRRPPFWRQGLALLLGVAYFAGAGLGGHQYLDDILLNLQVPRTRSLQILPGTTELWRSLFNKFGLSYETQQYILPVAAGVLAALAMFALALAWYLAARRRRILAAPGFLALALLLALGAALTPTPIFGHEILPACNQDILANYEEAGAHLARLIPPGSLVYWRGGLSPVPLLYIPGARIFPPQLNDGYSTRRGGDSQTLYRLGYWNADLSAQWVAQADYALFESSGYNGILSGSAQYEELEPTKPITCEGGSKILVFRRVK